LNFNLLFGTMFSMNMFFDFVTIVFNDHMFKVCTSKIHQNYVTTYKIGCQ
jgi:hypothetical protein